MEADLRPFAVEVATDGQPLQLPPALADLSQFSTNAIPDDEGAGSDESSLIVGQFDQLAIGFRHAERGLRGAVIYRKLSLGSQSTGGERRTQRLLSAHTTCPLQRRSLHAYLVDLLGAHARGDPPPLLA